MQSSNTIEEAIDFNGNEMILRPDSKEIFINKNKFNKNDLEKIRVISTVKLNPNDPNYTLIDSIVVVSNNDYIKLTYTDSVVPDCIEVYIGEKAVRSKIVQVRGFSPSDNWMCSDFDSNKKFSEL